MAEQHIGGKVAIVTGGSRGIGAEICKRLAAEGMAVVVNYASNVVEAGAVVEAIRAEGGKAITAKGDVSVVAEARGLFDVAEQVMGGVDVVVNNAGVMPGELPHIGKTDDGTFERVVGINFRGTFNMMREAATRVRDGGRVVNFSTSIVGMLLPGYGVYAGTKAAVEAMSAIMAKEMRGRNVTVNVVAPGPTGTELFLSGKTPERVEQMAKMAPLERLGQPVDIAGVVAFLVGADGGWVNGQVIRANGGIV